MAVKPIPEGYHTLTPYLIVKGASDALDFYAKAFGARELYRMADPSGKVVTAATGPVASLSVVDTGQVTSAQVTAEQRGSAQR